MGGRVPPLGTPYSEALLPVRVLGEVSVSYFFGVSSAITTAGVSTQNWAHSSAGMVRA